MAMHKAEHELSTAERNLERIRARAREENYASRSRQEFERKQKTFWDNYHDQKAKENWQEYNKNSFKEENWQNFGKKYTPPPMPVSIDNEHESFFMKWGNKSHTQITTKAEAKKIYRDAMKKYHPDLNLNDPIAALKAREITVGWGKIEHQPWFEKLASMRDLIRRIIHR
jgi:hypothetical protein